MKPENVLKAGAIVTAGVACLGAVMRAGAATLPPAPALAVRTVRIEPLS